MSDTPVSVSSQVAAPRKTNEKSSKIPRWEEKARDRISKGIRRLTKPTQLLHKKDASEADTRHLVTDILVELLGFDKYENLTAEFNVKGDWADYGIRIEKQIVAFVEVKQIARELSPKHLRQVESYALREGVEIAILTNGRVWQAYEVKANRRRQSEVTFIFEVDILDENVKLSHKVDSMLLLSIEGFTKGKLQEFVKKRNALSPSTLIPAILSETVINQIRKKVRQKSKFNVDSDDVEIAVANLLKKIEEI